MPPIPDVATLKRDVIAVQIDPLSRREIGEVLLPAGTVIEDAAAALREAGASGAEQVTVRVRYADGDVGLERVAVVELRVALVAEADRPPVAVVPVEPADELDLILSKHAAGGDLVATLFDRAKAESRLASADAEQISAAYWSIVADCARGKDRRDAKDTLTRIMQALRIDAERLRFDIEGAVAEARRPRGPK